METYTDLLEVDMIIKFQNSKNGFKTSVLWCIVIKIVTQKILIFTFSKLNKINSIYSLKKFQVINLRIKGNFTNERYIRYNQ